MEVYSKEEISILFLNEEHRCSMWRMAWADKSNPKMLVQKLTEFMEFRL